MPRSTQHNPRVDDQMKHETQSITHSFGGDSRSRDDLAPEAPLEGEPGATGAVREDVDLRDGPTTIEPEEANRRADLARVLKDIDWPASAPQLVAAAATAFAADAVVDALAGLPPAERYANVGEVWAALGGTVESRG